MLRNSTATIAGLLLAISFVPISFGQNEFVTVSKIVGEGDYTSIQEALDDPVRLFDDIVVQPGIYLENPVLSSNVILRAGEGPLLTVIDGSASVGGRLETLTIGSNSENVQVIGFNITGGRNGVFVETSSLGVVSNCVIEGNTADGVRLQWDGVSGPTALNVRNNVIKDNERAGLALQVLNNNLDFNPFLTVIVGNVFVNNTTFGIELRDSGNTAIRGVNLGETPLINYNNYFQNGSPYGIDIGPNNPIPVGLGETFNSPRFLGNTAFIAFDARLSVDPLSLLINQGPPESGQRDPDGSRNDQGAYGGPRAVGFFESVTDGPIVESIVATPPAVEQGQTLTIEAIVKVR